MSAHALHHTQHCICYFFVTESTTAKAVKAVKTSKASGSKGDPVDTIRCYLYAMRQAGMAQVDEADVLTAAGYKRTDSTGYRRAMKELIKESGIASLGPHSYQDVQAIQEVFGAEILNTYTKKQ